jgi:hypothetical protein
MSDRSREEVVQTGPQPVRQFGAQAAAAPALMGDLLQLVDFPQHHLPLITNVRYQPSSKKTAQLCKAR